MTNAEPCYLYGFMHTPRSAWPPLVGVFGASVRLESDGDLSAIVSPLPGRAQRATRTDVLAHSDVLQQLLPDYDVVPAAFGTVYPEGLDLAELPRPERRRLAKLLEELSGRVELQVRATYDEMGVTAALVDNDGRLRRLREARRQDYSTKLALGSRFAELLERQRQSDAARAAKRLSKPADRVVVEPPTGEWGAFRLAVLVQRHKFDDVESVLADMADEWASYLTVDWVGPVPPYTFVQPSTTRRAG